MPPKLRYLTALRLLPPSSFLLPPIMMHSSPLNRSPLMKSSRYSNNNFSNNFNFCRFRLFWCGVIGCSMLVSFFLLVTITYNPTSLERGTEMEMHMPHLGSRSKINTFPNDEDPQAGEDRVRSYVNDEDDDKDDDDEHENAFLATQTQQLQYQKRLYNGTCDYTKIPHPPLLWRWDGNTNFGDLLSTILIRRIVGESSTIEYNQPSKISKNAPKLFVVGSIMRHAAHCDIVWGTGVKNFHEVPRESSFLDVRAVRGPWSRRALMESNPDRYVPEIYGDPILLFPYYFPEFITSSEQRKGTLVILHFNDRNAAGSIPRSADVKIMHAIEPWEHIVGNITTHELVISSSLHGLIVADAFGIPARFLQLTLNEPPFKYKDYYLGTGRTYFPAHSFKEAMWLGGEKPIIFSPKHLIRAFPAEFFDSVYIPDTLK